MPSRSPHLRSAFYKLALVALPIFLTSCAALKISVQDPASVLRASRQDIITSGRLSPESQQVVRIMGSTEEEALKGDKNIFMVRDDRFEGLSSEFQMNYVESEVSIGNAIKLEKKDNAAAIGYYLRAGQCALQGILSKECEGSLDIRCDGLRGFYAASITGVFRLLQRQEWSTQEVEFHEDTLKYELSVSHDTKYESPSHYDSMELSAAIGLEGLNNRYRTYGFGVGITACRKKRYDIPEEEYFPKVGICIPLTAVLDFPETCSQGTCKAQLEFHNALTTKEVSLEGRKVRLAADLTAPFARVVDKVGMGGWDGLFGAFSSDEKLADSTGFYMLDPYDPKKIPLITVHGLFSNPITWMNVHNDLMGDPIIRDNFQVFHYLYPTNLPILLNARTFREKLDELEQYVVRERGSAKGLAGMVIISHSMGGLLSRTVVVKDSAAVKKVFLPDEKAITELDADTQKEMKAILDFGRKPYVSRVIFIATPHRGSGLADNWIGWIGRKLISLPARVVSSTKSLIGRVKNKLDPKAQEFLDNSDYSSVKGLSPVNPVIIALSSIAIDEHIPFHSIIGDQGKGIGPGSTDGVVPYTSSHLDQAQSELVVPADHTAHSHPLAVLEIRRILRLHLKENGIAVSDVEATAPQMR